MNRVIVSMRPEEWILSDDICNSSKTIWAVMMKVEFKNSCVPFDYKDFGNCYRLLKWIPEWKNRLNEVSNKYPVWKEVILNWDYLTFLFEVEKYDELDKILEIDYKSYKNIRKDLN